ncbi:MAG: response regulator transcription factor, partial [Methylococcales bacterium]|nr:response regulator transcription factor [Methylococcales bacterium]
MILIVDDEPTITTALSRYFSAEGYTTTTANSGREALAKLQPPPDLVVLDLMLPDIDGYQVCRHIRELSPYTPIIMLTAKDTLDDKIAGLDIGADAYLTKPYHPQELLAQARALLRRPRQTEQPIISCGEIELHLEEGIAYRHKKPIPLTYTEYDLLKIFMQNAGRVFGRETLLRKIWGYGALEISTRTVDTHIQRLRSKLEPDPKNPQY